MYVRLVAEPQCPTGTVSEKYRVSAVTASLTGLLVHRVSLLFSTQRQLFHPSFQL